MYVMLCATVKV